MSGRRSAALIGTAIILLFLFSIFNPPAMQFSSGSTLISIMQGSIFPTIRVPLKVKILYSLQDNPPLPAQGVIVRVGSIIQLTNREGLADFLVTPGNHSILAIWAKSRLRSWGQYLFIDRPLTLTILFKEMHVPIRAIEIWSNASSMFTKVRVTFKAPVGEAVYASEPFLYYIDAEGGAGRHPRSLGGNNLLLYYITLIPGEVHEISVNVPSSVALLSNTRSFIPIQIVNSTLREAA